MLVKGRAVRPAVSQMTMRLLRSKTRALQRLTHWWGACSHLDEYPF